jgi:hypothetical protein
MSNTITVTVFTGAPEAADYSTAKTLETFETHNGGRSMTWRKVELTGGRYQVAYQCDRYRSFLDGLPTLDDPREVHLGMGRMAPSAECERVLGRRDETPMKSIWSVEIVGNDAP